MYINFDNVEYCPYHKNATILKYKRNSTLRKPNNGMVKNIRRNWLLDNKNCFMIGDQEVDKKCAERSKLYFEYPKKNILKQVQILTQK